MDSTFRFILCTRNVTVLWRDTLNSIYFFFCPLTDIDRYVYYTYIFNICNTIISHLSGVKSRCRASGGTRVAFIEPINRGVHWGRRRTCAHILVPKRRDTNIIYVTDFALGSRNIPCSPWSIQWGEEGRLAIPVPHVFGVRGGNNKSLSTPRYLGKVLGQQSKSLP